MPAKKGVLSETEMHVWSHMDLQTDSIPGMSIVKAYAFLEGKQGSCCYCCNCRFWYRCGP